MGLSGWRAAAVNRDRLHLVVQQLGKRSAQACRAGRRTAIWQRQFAKRGVAKQRAGGEGAAVPRRGKRSAPADRPEALGIEARRGETGSAGLDA